MIKWSTLVGTGDDVIGYVFADEIQPGEIVADPAGRKWKTGSHLTHFHHPVIAKIRVVGHLKTKNSKLN